MFGTKKFVTQELQSIWLLNALITHIMTNLCKRESAIDCVYSYFIGGTCYHELQVVWQRGVKLKCVRASTLDALGFREEKKNQSTKWKRLQYSIGKERMFFRIPNSILIFPSPVSISCEFSTKIVQSKRPLSQRRLSFFCQTFLGWRINF
jgi:hypothetical protein